MPAPLLGSLGPYDLLEEVGRGGMGVVYRAHRADLDRVFALKVLPPALAEDADARARFLREAQSAARLAGHPGIVAVHDAGEAPLALPGRPAGPPVAYLAMDFVPGRSLDALIDEGELPADAIAPMFQALAEALAYAHERGVLHRDLKPANILVGPDGRARLADFGLARVQALEDDARRLTRTDTLLGTPQYMAPEQVCDPAVDGRADVYGLGAALYHTCTGRPPIDGPTLPARLRAVLEDAPTPPRRIDATVSPGLAAVAMRCLAKAPSDRYPDATALAEDLRRVARGESPTLGGRRGRRRWMGAGVAGGVLVALAAVWAVGRARSTVSPAAPPAADGGPAAWDRERAATAAFLAVVEASGSAMDRLCDHWHSARLAPAAVAAHRRAVEAAAAAATARYPGAGAPAAWVALARVYAGDRAGDAVLARLEAADGSDPYPALLRARLMLGAYARHRPLPELAFGSGPPELIPVEDGPLDRHARDVAAASLARVLALPPRVWTGPVRELEAFARGAAAVAHGDSATARHHLAGLLDDAVVGADAAYLLAVAEFAARDFAAAASRWERLAARGWVDARLKAGSARQANAVVLGGAGRPDPAELRRAAAHLDAVIGIEPGNAAARRARAANAILLASDTAGPPPPDAAALLRQAVEDYDAMEAAKRLGSADRRGRAVAWMARARLAPAAGALDECLTRARADLAAAIAAGDVLGGARVRLVECEVALAQAAVARGADPTTTLQAALAAAADLVAAEPRNPDALRQAAYARQIAAQAAAADGRDPGPLLATALEACAAGLAVDPDHLGLLHLSAQIRMERVGRSGVDTAVDLAAARAALEHALQLRPGHPALELALAKVGYLQSGQPGVPRPEARRLLAASIAACDRVLGGAPGHADARQTRGVVRAAAGALATLDGEDARPLFDAAIADLEGALAADPDNVRLRFARADAWRQRAAAEAQRGADPGAAAASAIAAYESVLALQPRQGRAHRGIGYVWWDRVRLGAAAGRAEAARRAVAAFDRALACDPRDWGALTFRGLAREELHDVEGARADYRQAVAIHPGASQARARLADLDRGR